MNTNKQKGIGLLEVLGLIVLWWCVFYIFFDWQISVRVENANPSADIFNSFKDSAIKSFTITDHEYNSPVSITNDSDD